MQVSKVQSLIITDYDSTDGSWNIRVIAAPIVRDPI